MSVTNIEARQVFDSRGNPTVEVNLSTAKGDFRAIVPSGASTGTYEALELRDKGDAYFGKGVTKAVSNVNNIIWPEIQKQGIKIDDQTALDEFLIKLDGTPNKSKLGANAILGVSVAAAKAGAADAGLPLYAYFQKLAGKSGDFILPVPCLNVINGGVHAGNALAFQEFMIVPTGATSFTEAFRFVTETYHHLKSLIKKRYGPDAVNVGDEGGFAPNIRSADEGLDLLKDAIEAAGYTGKIKIAFDAASSEFFKDGKYDLDFKNPNSDKSKFLTGKELADVYLGYLEKYDIVFVEDPFDQDGDWESWAYFNEKIEVQLVADDLVVTNPIRIQKAIDKKAANALLLKINQIGSITESIRAALLAQSDGWGVLVSHRSGETEDTTIADLVVGLGVGQIKTGAPARSERVSKYNALLRIEDDLVSSGKPAIFAQERGFAAGKTPAPLSK